MICLWPFLIFSLLGLFARGSPLTSTTPTLPSPLSTVSGAGMTSGTLTSNQMTSTWSNTTLRNTVSVNGSKKAEYMSGVVTLVKTIELIPQPALSDPFSRPKGSHDSSNTLITDIGVPPRTTRRAPLPTSSPPATPRISAKPSKSPSLHRPTSLLVEYPKLEPIIVGGITYAPVHTQDRHSDTVPWQGNLLPSQTTSRAGKWNGYPGEGSESPTLGPAHSEQNKPGLPPVIIGGLTYTPISRSRTQTTAPLDVAASTTRTAKPVTRTSAEEESTTYSSHSDPPSANSHFPTLQNASTSASSQSSSNTLLTISPTHPSPSPNPPHPFPFNPSTFILASQTFTAYPLGLAIAGTEVFQHSNSITVSGTAISLGSSDVVIGTSTIAFASVAGLGAALSSGLVSSTSASETGIGSGFGPSVTSTDVGGARGVSAGRVERAGQKGFVWVVAVVTGAVLGWG